MKRFYVEMLAFEPKDAEHTMRPVDIPDEAERYAGDKPTLAMLDTIFRYGQNDVTPSQDYCSVSEGDVIHVGPHRYLVNRTYGFTLLTPEQYEEYRALPRDVREGSPDQVLDRYDWRRRLAKRA